MSKMTTAERKAFNVANEVYRQAFMILDSIEELTGDEAGRIAQAAHDVVEQMLLKIFNA